MGKYITRIIKRIPDDKIGVGEYVSTVLKIEDGSRISNKGDVVRIVFKTAEGNVGGAYNLNQRRLTSLFDACGIACEDGEELDLDSLIGKKCAIVWGLNSKGYPIPMTHSPAEGKPAYRNLTPSEWTKLGCDASGKAGAAQK